MRDLQNMQLEWIKMSINQLRCQSIKDVSGVRVEYPAVAASCEMSSIQSSSDMVSISWLIRFGVWTVRWDDCVRGLRIRRHY